MGVPAWLLLLAAFNQRLTKIPWLVGMAMASVLAVAIVAVADQKMGRRGPGGRLGPFGRALIVWVAVFFVLALIIGSSTSSGLGFLLLPFILATLAAAGVELARRASGRR